MSQSNVKMPTLFYDDVSPPVRFVLMTALHLDVPLELHKIDLFKEENRTEYYKQINPLCKVPSMQVNDEIIMDSHAIAIYLCEVSNKSLYPENPLQRAHTLEMMFYNSSTLFPIDSAIYTDYFAGKEVDQSRVARWTSAMSYLETRLQKNAWLSGNEMTLSDICCVATVSSLELMLPMDKDHPHLASWFQKMKEQPCYEANKAGLKRLHEFIQLLK